MSQAPVSDGNYEYEETELNGDTIQYHRVTDDTKGTVNVPGGTRETSPGDVLVPGPSGSVYNVYGEEEFNNLTSGSESDDDDSDVGEVSDEEGTVPDSESEESPFRSK
jgi:hypothetical protein